jgi:hypothetical protein
MKDRKILLVHSSKGNISFFSKGVDTHMQTLPLLSGSLRVEREQDEHKTRISLSYLTDRAASQPQPLTTVARAFLAQYVSPAVLEVFPEWQGMLIESPTLGEAVWVVRDHQNGRRLAQETGQPFILLDEILAQEGQS